MTVTHRLLNTFIPDMPQSVDWKVKREEHLAREALEVYNRETGRRKPDLREEEAEESESDKEDVDGSTLNGHVTGDSGAKSRPVADHNRDESQPKSNVIENLNRSRERSPPKESTPLKADIKGKQEYSYEYLTQML